MNKMTFSRLFEPIKIGNMTLKNRIAMAPMGSSLATKDGLVTENMIEYYEARAKGGVGLVIVESTNIDSCRHIHEPNRPAIDSDLTLPGCTKLARVIKKHGARAAIQLNHYGGYAKAKLSGFQPVAPSAIPYPAGSAKGEVPKELTVEEIHDIVDLFAQCAARAKKAGFDGIEVNAAHRHLLAQFMSPFTNKRQDQYGGSVGNRARILIEVLKAIRKATSDAYPLWCRVNGQEYGAEGVLTLDDARAMAMMTNDMVDAIHVTAFGYGDAPLTNFPDTPGELLPLAEAIKKVVSVPVIAVGKLDLEVGEQAIRDGKADIIALGRRLIAEPELPSKALSGRLDDIRPCIACFSCHDIGVLRNSPITCAVNAAVAKGSEYEMRPARQIKTIAIIGGGPAGMEAARALTTRGHRVVLFEKTDRLGGQLRLAMMPPQKRERIEPLITYMATQLQKLKVEIRLNTEANIEVIDKLKPDVVILAVGVIPNIPRLSHVDPDRVVTAFDILAGKAEAGRKVVVIGGGSVGCETADFLFEEGKEVTVVEMLTELAADMGARDRTRLMSRITRLPITFIAGAKCDEIQKGGIVVTRGDKGQFIPADTVVIAVGSKPNNRLFSLLRAKGFETHLAGDCRHVARIADAIGDGLRLGCAI